MLVDFLQADFKVLLYSKRSIGTEHAFFIDKNACQ